MQTSSFTSFPGTVPTEKNIPVKKIRRVLGFDPGLASTGFGVIDYYQNKYRLVSYGVIETKAHEEYGQRLLTIYNRISAVISEFKPDEAGIEILFFSKNVSSAMAVAEAKGVISLCLAQNCIPLAEYTPNIIKQAVTGSIKADKALVQSYVKLLLGLETVPKPDHAADALAAAITHIHTSSLSFK
jgi:crossover junction endodeoxyribonuclease RuvC